MQKKIAFIIYYPYQWFIYKPIYHLLPEESREIILDMTIHQKMQSRDLEDLTVAFMKEEGVAFRVLKRIDLLNIEYMTLFFSQVEVIVSCWESGCVGHESVTHIKKVCTTYGLAKELTMLRPTRSLYDVILAYGKRDANLFEMLTKSIAIGNPRADFLYKKNITLSKKTCDLKNSLPFFKKVILYVPTHGDLGSFKEMFPVFRELRDDYTIIFKPHYYSLREDKEFIDKYKNIEGVYVLDDTWDTLEVMSIADAIVSDNSSSIFDAMQTGKTIIVSDFLTSNFLDVTHKRLRLAKRGLVGASTFSKSFEQEIKEKDFIQVIKKPEELKAVLQRLPDIIKKYKEVQKRLVSEFFSYTDGSSSRRAVDIIWNIYNTPRQYVPGILHHAYLAFSGRLYKILINTYVDIPKLSSSKKTIILVICQVNNPLEQILSTIYSAISNDNVECVYVSGVSLEEVEIKNLKGVPIVSAKDFNTVVRAIKNTQGKDLLIVRPNSLVKELLTISAIKSALSEKVIFFADNTNYFSYKRGELKILQQEILQNFSFTKKNIFATSYPNIESVDKCAVLLDLALFNEQTFEFPENCSFELVVSFCIQINILSSNSFFIMPNMISSYCELSKEEYLLFLTERAKLIASTKISFGKILESKFIFFLFLKLILGDVRYFYVIKLIIHKMLLILYFRLSFATRHSG